MAIIHPFRGLRPTGELAEKVASPPYDVLNSDEARKLAEGNPYSFLHVVKPEIDLPREVGLYEDAVYEKGAENLRRFITQGVLVQDDRPCLYLYRQKMGEHVQTGVVACASVEEYEKGTIRKHELTRQDKERDRIRHIEAQNAQSGPVFLTYRARAEIRSLVARLQEADPVYHFTAEDSVEHTFWVVSDRDAVQALVDAFGEVDVLYVADGHHRSAAATEVCRRRRRANPNHTGKEEYNYFLSVLFPHDEMQILPYNRVVQDLGGRDEDSFLAEVRRNFAVAPTERPEPDRPHEFGMFLGGRWYRLAPKPELIDGSDPVASLDVSILQEHLLRPILGIENPRTDERIDFVGGIRGIGELERRCQKGGWAVAFALYPTTVEQLLAVADAGRIMPPKSTWFEPKLRSGLVVHLLNE